MPAPWKKSYGQPRHSSKKWDITLPTNVHVVKAMFFPVVMYRCESWTTEKAEHWRMDTFELWCWRRLLRVPWTASRSNQSKPKGNQPWIFTGRTEAEAEAPVLWPPDAKSRLIERVMLGKIEGKRRRGQQRMRWLDSIADSMDMNLGKLREIE